MKCSYSIYFKCSKSLLACRIFCHVQLSILPGARLEEERFVSEKLFERLIEERYERSRRSYISARLANEAKKKGSLFEAGLDLFTCWYYF